jgi:hypothetical protein
MALKMGGEDHLDRLCEKYVSVKQSAVEQGYAIYIERKEG